MATASLRTHSASCNPQRTDLIREVHNAIDHRSYRTRPGQLTGDESFEALDAYLAALDFETVADNCELFAETYGVHHEEEAPPRQMAIVEFVEYEPSPADIVATMRTGRGYV